MLGSQTLIFSLSQINQYYASAAAERARWRSSLVFLCPRTTSGNCSDFGSFPHSAQVDLTADVFSNWKKCFGVSGRAKGGESWRTVLFALTETIKDRRKYKLKVSRKLTNTTYSVSNFKINAPIVRNIWVSEDTKTHRAYLQLEQRKGWNAVLKKCIFSEYNQVVL